MKNQEEVKGRDGVSSSPSHGWAEERHDAIVKAVPACCFTWEVIKLKCPAIQFAAGDFKDEVVHFAAPAGGRRRGTATSAVQIDEVYKSSSGKVLLSDPRTLCLHKHRELLSQFFAFNSTDGLKIQIPWQIA